MPRFLLQKQLPRFSNVAVDERANQTYCTVSVKVVVCAPVDVEPATVTVLVPLGVKTRLLLLLPPQDASKVTTAMQSMSDNQDA